jgi:hypothetical protein
MNSSAYDDKRLYLCVIACFVEFHTAGLLSRCLGKQSNPPHHLLPFQILDKYTI